MRDGAIVDMQTANARRSALLFDQFEFLDTRMEAMERALVLSSWVIRLKWVFRPEEFLRTVRTVQSSLLQSRRAAHAATKAKIKLKI